MGGATAILLAAAALAPSASRPALPDRISVGAQGRVELADQVNDVLIIDGKVEIEGVVRGYLVAVDAEVVVRASAVMLRPIRLVGGHLEVERGAVLPASIELYGARLTRPDQSVANPPPSGRLELAIGQTQVSLSPSELDPGQHALMKAVLPFDRFVPKNGAGIEVVARLDPGLGLRQERSTAAPRELLVGGVLKLSFVSDKVVAAWQSGWAGPRGRALLAAVELKDPESAAALWDALAAVPESKVRHSVRTRLGRGAHWFFTHDDRAVLLWTRDRWFFALETRLDADPSTLAQQTQFSAQVGDALRRSLEQAP